MKENYVTSPEESKEAEWMMDKKQEKMSCMREEAIENIGDDLFKDLKEGKFDLKIDGYVYGKIDPDKDFYIGDDVEVFDDNSFCIGRDFNKRTGGKFDNNWTMLWGKIGKRDVRINFDFTGEPEKYDGKIDGKPISIRLAIELYNKYYDIANLQSEYEFKSRAEDEIRKEGLEYQKKEKEKAEKEFLEAEERLSKMHEEEKKREEKRKEFIAKEKEQFKDLL